MQDPFYKPPQKEIWIGRTDGKKAPRIHDIIEMGRFGIKDKAHSAFALLGFASDVGVKRNQGRIGSALGPEAFRKAFANIPLLDQMRIKDFGDVVCNSKDLEKAQDNFKIKLKELWKRGYIPFSIGGGHDMSFPHYQALTETFPGLNIGIINIDAHLDLRTPLEGPLSTSGSSFFQIQSYLNKRSKPFHYLCLGAQKFANTVDLWDRLDAFKGKAILAEEIVLNKAIAAKTISAFLKKVDKVYLTICLDVFSANFAPGVSASSPFGLSPYDALPLMRLVKRSNKMLSFDIAELNPKFDIDARTAKLSALLAMEMLNKEDF